MSGLTQNEAQKTGLALTNPEKVVVVTGFEPVTFWSRIMSSSSIYVCACPVLTPADRIFPDENAPSGVGFGVAQSVFLSGLQVDSIRFSAPIHRIHTAQKEANIMLIWSAEASRS